MRNTPAVFLIIALFSGCQSAETRAPSPGIAPPPHPAAVSQWDASFESQPIDLAPEGSKPVAFKRVILSMQSGAPIGRVTGGLLKVFREPITATPGEGSKQFDYIGREELRKAHYTTPDETNDLFGENESAKARYELGADIPSIQLDINIVPGWASVTWHSDGVMIINWEVFDTVAKKVVFKKEVDSIFHESVSGSNGQAPIFRMFRQNMRQLLADPEFVKFMRPNHN